MNMWNIALFFRVLMFIKSRAHFTNKIKQNKTPWLLLRKRTISTERPPLVGEI
jgi:hypothetical protein